MARPKKVKEEVVEEKVGGMIAPAATTTESVAPPTEDLEKVKELEEKVESKKGKKDFLNYCAFCNKKLTAFVAANELRFCSDACCKEFFE